MPYAGLRNFAFPGCRRASPSFCSDCTEGPPMQKPILKVVQTTWMQRSSRLSFGGDRSLIEAIFLDDFAVFGACRTPLLHI